MHEAKRYYGYNETIQKAIKEYESSSHSAAAIAQKYNICPSSIYYYRRQSRIIPRQQMAGDSISLSKSTSNKQQAGSVKHNASNKKQLGLLSRMEETENILSKYNINK